VPSAGYGSARKNEPPNLGGWGIDGARGRGIAAPFLMGVWGVNGGGECVGGNDALAQLDAAIAERVHAPEALDFRNGNMIPPNIPLHRRAECAGQRRGASVRPWGIGSSRPSYLLRNKAARSNSPLTRLSLVAVAM